MKEVTIVGTDLAKRVFQLQAAEFQLGVVRHPQVRRQMGREHFSVGGTLVDAWALMKSFRPKEPPGHDDGDDDGRGGRNAGRYWRSERRSNETHASTIDPDAQLYKKAPGQASRLCFVATALMENRNGLVVDGAGRDPHAAQGEHYEIHPAAERPWRTALHAILPGETCKPYGT